MYSTACHRCLNNIILYMYAYKHIYIYDLCIHLMYLNIYHLEYTRYVYIYTYMHTIFKEKSIKLRPQEFPKTSTSNTKSHRKAAIFFTTHLKTQKNIPDVFRDLVGVLNQPPTRKIWSSKMGKKTSPIFGVKIPKNLWCFSTQQMFCKGRAPCLLINILP